MNVSQSLLQGAHMMLRKCVKDYLQMTDFQYGLSLTVKDIESAGVTIFDRVYLAGSIIAGPNYNYLCNHDFYSNVSLLNAANLIEAQSIQLSIFNSIDTDEALTLSDGIRCIIGDVFPYLVVLFGCSEVNLDDLILGSAIETLANYELTNEHDIYPLNVDALIATRLINSDSWFFNFPSKISSTDILTLSSTYYE